MVITCPVWSGYVLSLGYVFSPYENLLIVFYFSFHNRFLQ